jgi:hypothetical protein
MIEYNAFDFQRVAIIWRTDLSPPKTCERFVFKQLPIVMDQPVL